MSSSSPCEHSRRIEDDHTGTEVCTECGLVLDILYYAPHTQKAPELWQKENPHVLEEEVKTICARLYIESNTIVKDTVHYYKKLKNQTGTKKKCAKSLIAFSLWETLNLANSPHSPQTIAFAAEIDEKEILDVEKSFQIRSTYCTPSSYVDRICDTLFLPPYVRGGVKRIVSALYMFGSYRPETLIAACIMLFVRKIREKHGKQLFPEISTKYLCSKLGPSYTSVNKLSHRIDSQVIENALCAYPPPP